MNHQSNSTGIEAMRTSEDGKPATLRGFAADFGPLLLFMALNAGSYLALYMLGVPRTYLLNADYLVPILLFFSLRSRWPGSAAWAFSIVLMLLLIVDIVGRIGNLFLVSLSFLAEYMRFASHWPWPILLIGAAILTLFVVLSLAVAKRLPPVRSVVLATLPILILPIADMLAAGHPALPNILSSALRSSAEPLVQAARSTPFQLVPAPESWATDPDLAKTAPARTLSIAVESLGTPIDPDQRRRLLAPVIQGLKGRYRLVRNSDHLFEGGTLSGEFRELCGLMARGIPREGDQLPAGHKCLPAQEHAEAHARAIALHGNNASFYNRRFIYPAIGFTETIFSDDLRFRGAERCGKLVFGGICDKAVYRQALSLFRSNEPTLVHVITLDTHFPILERGGCTTAAGSIPCNYEAAIHRTLRELVVSVDTAAVKPDRIVLYGYHAPPFLDQQFQLLFSARHVPFLVFDRVPDATS